MAEEISHHAPKDNSSPIFGGDNEIVNDIGDGDDYDADRGDRHHHEEEEVVDANDDDDDDDVADGEDIGNGWVAYKDDDNRTYYYHVESGETQWDRPQITLGVEVEEAADVVVEETTEEDPDADATPATDVAVAAKDAPSLSVDDVDDAADEDGSPWLNEQEQQSATKEDDSIKKYDTKLRNAAVAEQFLQQPDAVMEPNVLDHIDILVQELGPQEAGPKAMQSLINGYSGDTAICGLLGLWLAQLKSSTTSTGTGETTLYTTTTGKSNVIHTSAATSVDENTPPPLQSYAADSARDVVEKVIHQLAKERFTKNYGDAIVKLPKKDAAFIDNMIASYRWRKLLIDLSATNKESKLFLYCLQTISNLGYHREIANRINQAEYFGVFNSMLQSELTITAKLSVDGYRRDVINDTNDNAMDTTTKDPMGSLVADLRRTCTSTSYTYLFAMAVFKALISKSKQTLSDDKCTTHIEYLKRAIRKWERLREELEDEMLTPIKTGTTFQRKRKIDVALIMSDLFQRKRRRMDPMVKNSNNAEENDDDGVDHRGNSELEDTLDTAISQLLMKNSLGIQLDKESADSVLKFAYGGSTDRIGDILIEHPTAIHALLDNLFVPKQRIRQLETRLKFARLLALAVTASERAATRLRDGAQSILVTECNDDDVLSQVILKGSQLCEQLENMVSFTVLDNIDQNTEGSAGRQLSALCIRHSVVARGVLIWAKAFAGVSDFVSTASYPTISPCILSLARLICRHQPLTRSAVLEVSLIFLGHSNREISHRTMQSIKEQSLRLLLWLSTQGVSLAVISAVQNKLEKVGSTDMDAALVRYFFAGLIEIIRPPFSVPFVRALGGLLVTVADALQSIHFESSKRKQLRVLMNQFETAINVQELLEEDKSLLSTLKSTYFRDC